MRHYGIVSPKFWIGETGKLLRGNPEAQVLALYLMTSPHSNMIGVFHCPILYMAHETGLSVEGATKGLQRLSEVGFCTYEEASETVFIHRMARFQVAEQLKPDDKRVKGINKDWSNIESASIRAAFFAIYSVAFHLKKEDKKGSPFKAPSKPEAGTGTGTGTKHPSPSGELVGFEKFWLTWPKSDRKVAKGKCLEAWVKANAEVLADSVVAHVERLKASQGWRKDGGQFIPAPLAYLNQRQWEGTEAANRGANDWVHTAGFGDLFEAENAGCKAHNAHQFRDGKRITEAA